MINPIEFYLKSSNFQNMQTVTSFALRKDLDLLTKWIASSIVAVDIFILKQFRTQHK